LKQAKLRKNEILYFRASLETPGWTDRVSPFNNLISQKFLFLAAVAEGNSAPA
jgi:hypothetical protein